MPDPETPVPSRIPAGDPRLGTPATDRPTHRAEARSGSTTVRLADDGRLTVSRDGATVLAGAAPSLRAFNGGASITPGVTLEALPDGAWLTAEASGADTVELCLELASGRHWYGLGELLNQLWPLEETALQRTPLATWDNGISGLGDILEPVWFTATGVGLWLAPDEPDAYSISLNDPPDAADVARWTPALNVVIPSAERPNAVRRVGGDGRLTLRVAGSRLRIRLIVGDDLRDVQQRFVALVGHPSAPPPTRHLALPIWTTWARYKSEIDQAVVLRYLGEIEAAGFPIGTLELDDRWQRAYGDLEFDASRFPDPKAMIDAIHARGVEVTAWVIPFINPDAACLAEAIREGFLIRTPGGEPYLVPWWQGPGYPIDLTNARAVEWFHARLERLRRETGLDGFKFDAGKSCYHPADAVTAEPVSPNGMSHRYIEFVGRAFPSSDVRTAWRNQRSTVLVREWDKFSLWGLDNGLQAVLSQALTLSLIGYPFVLADMIGGNEYEDQKTDAEMMVRWAQANALLPAIQFSLAPWDFGSEVATLCRAATELHVAFGPEFERLAAEAVATGAPIVRPLVWQFPDDRTTETIWDEFLLGERWLAAPVVEQGVRHRDIYLPRGTWRDDRGAVHAGPVWLRGVDAPLDRLPYFERLD